MKKLICWCTLLCLLLAAMPTSLAEDKAHDITESIIDLYFYNSTSSGSCPSILSMALTCPTLPCRSGRPS